MTYLRRLFLLCSLLGMFLFISLTASPQRTYAQNPELTYGSTTIGKLDVGVPFMFFGFSGQAGDLVTVRLISFDHVFMPTLSIIAPTGQQLAFSWQDITAPGNNARVDVLLPQDGFYNIQVGAFNGTEGQFLVRLDGFNVDTARSALSGNVVLADFSSSTPLQVFRVDGALNAVQTLQFAGGGGPFSVSIHGGNGVLLGVVASNPQGLAYFALPPNDATYTILVNNTDIQPQTIQFNITESDTPAGLPIGDTSGDTTSTQTVGEQVASATGACDIATGEGGTNLRTGPGTGYAVLTTLPGQTSYRVTGQNNGWYAISYQGGTGWLFGGVTTQTGACSSVAVIAAPALPAAGSAPVTTGAPQSPPSTGGSNPPPPPPSTGTGRNTPVPPPTNPPPPPTSAPPPTNPPPPPTSQPPGWGDPILLPPDCGPYVVCDIP